MKKFPRLNRHLNRNRFGGLKIATMSTGMVVLTVALTATLTNIVSILM